MAATGTAAVPKLRLRPVVNDAPVGAARLRGIVAYWSSLGANTEKLHKAKSDIAFMGECLRLAEVHVGKLSELLRMMDGELTAARAAKVEPTSGE